MPRIGSETVRERAVLIGGGDNSQATALFDEPSPTRAEAGCGRGGEFILEGVKGSEGSIDGLGEVTLGCAASFGSHDLPEEVVIVGAAAVIADDVANAFGNSVQIAEQSFHEGFAQRVRGSFLQRRSRLVM
jgi:hypothetical protein